MMKIELGDKVRCKITGYEGIATSRTEFINGCIQIDVARRLKKGSFPKEEEVNSLGIDEGSLERIGPGINKKTPIKKKSTGGPMSKSRVRRNY